MTFIKPSSLLRNNYKEISSICHSTGQPIHITLNGEGDTVILSNEMFAQIEEKLALLELYENLGVDITEKLAEAEKEHLSDSKKHSHDDVMIEMRNLISQKTTEV